MHVAGPLSGRKSKNKRSRWFHWSSNADLETVWFNVATKMLISKTLALFLQVQQASLFICSDLWLLPKIYPACTQKNIPYFIFQRFNNRHCLHTLTRLHCGIWARLEYSWVLTFSTLGHKDGKAAASAQENPQINWSRILKDISAQREVHHKRQ